jgi:hypothetical protein
VRGEAGVEAQVVIARTDAADTRRHPTVRRPDWLGSWSMSRWQKLGLKNGTTVPEATSRWSTHPAAVGVA